MRKTRNRFEKKFADAHPELEYEALKLSCTLECSYLPDFIDRATRTIFETKGLWEAADRRKVLAVMRQNPDWTVVMVFQNPNRKISKASKTTYAAWCDKHGIRWQAG